MLIPYSHFTQLAATPFLLSPSYLVTPFHSPPTHPVPTSHFSNSAHASHKHTHSIATPASLCHHSQSHSSHSHMASISLTLKHHCPSSLPLTASPSSLHRRSKVSPLTPTVIADLFSTSLQFFFLKYFIITFSCKSKNQRKPIVFLSIS